MLIIIRDSRYPGIRTPMPFTERLLFIRQNGALVGTFLSMTGKKPLNDLRVHVSPR